MLRQHRTGQEKIGFESANAGTIDQGWQHVQVERKKLKEKIFRIVNFEFKNRRCLIEEDVSKYLSSCHLPRKRPLQWPVLVLNFKIRIPKYEN